MAPDPTSPPRHLFKAGDTVKHRPSGEEWVLACDEEMGRVMPAGWPESLASASDCDLLTAASFAEQVDMLQKASGGSGYRASLARHQLKSALETKPMPDPVSLDALIAKLRDLPMTAKRCPDGLHASHLCRSVEAVDKTAVLLIADELAALLSTLTGQDDIGAGIYGRTDTLSIALVSPPLVPADTLKEPKCRHCGEPLRLDADGQWMGPDTHVSCDDVDPGFHEPESASLGVPEDTRTEWDGQRDRRARIHETARRGEAISANDALFLLRCLASLGVVPPPPASEEPSK